MVTAIIATMTTPPTVNTYVEYSTRFSGGQSVDTLNSAVPLGTFLRLPGETKVQVPNLRDAGELYRLHRYVIAEVAKIAPGDTPIVYPEGGAFAYLREMLHRSYEQQAQLGLFRREGVSESLVYRPTLRGAYRMTWRQLAPYSNFVKEQMETKAAKIMRDFRASTWYENR